MIRLNAFRHPLKRAEKLRCKRPQEFDDSTWLSEHVVAKKQIATYLTHFVFGFAAGSERRP